MFFRVVFPHPHSSPRHTSWCNIFFVPKQTCPHMPALAKTIAIQIDSNTNVSARSMRADSFGGHLFCDHCSQSNMIAEKLHGDCYRAGVIWAHSVCWCCQPGRPMIAGERESARGRRSSIGKRPLVFERTLKPFCPEIIGTWLWVGQVRRPASPWVQRPCWIPVDPKDMEITRLAQGALVDWLAFYRWFGSSMTRLGLLQTWVWDPEIACAC